MARKRRYPTDLSDLQWKLVEPLLPEPPPGPAGRPPKHEKREIVNAILYQVRAGGSWRMLPRDFPPWETVYGYFARWRDDGTLDALHDALREQVRAKRERRNPVPSAGIVDSQTVKGADTVGSATRGFDAGKKLNGRKRHIVTDTIGLLLVVMVTAASIQDRDGGRGILKLLHGSLAAVALVYADGGYQGRLVTIAKRAWGIVLEIVRKPADQQGFAVLPPPLGRRAHLLLAFALAAPRPRLRTPARDTRSNGQVGDGRPHAQPPRPTTRPEAMGHQAKALMTNSKHLLSSRRASSAPGFPSAKGGRSVVRRAS